MKVHLDITNINRFNGFFSECQDYFAHFESNQSLGESKRVGLR